MSKASARITTLDYADLEIGLHRRDGDNAYTIDMRFSHPENDADIRLPGSDPSLVRFDTQLLRGLTLQMDTYGQSLSTSLFSETHVTTLFQQAISTAQTLDIPLRLRLLIGASAPELHSFRWETLTLPQSDELLVTNETILFSRYLSSTDWRPARLRSKSDLHALVVVANPADLSDYSPDGQVLPPFDVPGELERVRIGMEGMHLTELAAPGTATLSNIGAHLRDGYDILYIVAHGAFIDGEPYLWMENETGEAAVVPGRNLVRQMKEHQRLPRLVVLISCESAGLSTISDVPDATAGALASLGPRLAEIGVPAVLAMQGRISLESMNQLLPVFFHELQRTGQIDRALAVARSTIRERPDWWMPVLFMRIKSGRIWYVAGFGDEGQDFEKWPALIRNIQRGNCTPIIGPRLTEMLPVSVEDIAQHWSEAYNFPMAPYEREQLPQVAQYLAVMQDFQFPRDELLEQLRQDILYHYGKELPNTLHDADLNEMFAAVGAIRRQRNPMDPYKVLADLPFRIYITANFSNLLTEALLAVGKKPRVEVCRWNQDIEALPSVFEEDEEYLPDIQEPLIYHLFGELGEPDSLVITQDDYFDYLLGVAANRELIPIAVREALADTGLIFLGFQLYDWSFRVLFRSLMSQQGRGRRKRYAHVAGQITPDEGRLLEPEGARSYLESYFQDSAIDIFWGSADDFVQQLLKYQEHSDSTSSRTARRERRRR